MMRLKYILLIALLVSACAPTATPQPTSSATTVLGSPAPKQTQVPAQTPAETPVIVPNTPISAPVTGPIQIDLVLMVSGITNPTNLVSANDDSDRLFVTAKPGQVQIISKDQLLSQPFLDISDLVDLKGSDERGLLGLAFSPNYTTDGFFYLDYTRQPDGATVIARYSVSKDDPNLADPNSGVTILKIDQPQANHNGGQLAFGLDGYLYIGMGDGGGGGDQHGTIGNGQNLNKLLGKILRIDVRNTDRYAIPSSNPFGTEVWAYGLRNPWRFSFDRSTGDLYIADVGQNTYEEIDFQPAASHGGENYGWRIMEAVDCYDPGNACDPTQFVSPVTEYTHDQGCAVVGGYVYRGQKYPQWQGLYFFADYCSGTIWSLQRDASSQWQIIRRLDSSLNISSFGQDQAGELYVVGHGDGTIYRLAAQ
ncbi:MAG TPA: PQQ-dependent sugar dehydrogenase [Anaerolineae bacterium]|nr:PQQ-dependent sugar dehydrogenase [Anaerolineae bacterium]